MQLPDHWLPNERSQIICFWCGVVAFLLFWLATWPVSGLIPPPSPHLDGTDLLAKYEDNMLGLRFGIILGMFAAMLFVPWSTVLAIHVGRMERGFPIMGITCFGAGVANAVAFYLPFIFWAAAYYRLDRSPELVLLLNDMAWLEFVMLAPPFAVQAAAVAIAGLQYKGEEPSPFPRWFCFLSLWVALLLMPGVVAIYFFSGPFAWNGLLAFWLPVTVFVIYFCAAFPLVYKAIRQHAHHGR